MNIGAMRHRITLQQLITTTNQNGFGEEEWKDFKTVWASVENLYGHEFWAAKAVQAETIKKFTIRYLKEIDDTRSYRILFDNKIFDIIPPIDNIKHLNRYMEIKAKEVS